ncbi:MAG: aspartate/glutamate racemase family protein [Anaerolineaceae bacterium]|nr:aspartate/glutamate racemase family protein [Anaerolineaceae bacterium]
MKRIGILGGMSPESTVAYYEQIVRQYMAEFHDHGYPEILIHSVTFQPYIGWQEKNQWDVMAEELTHAAQGLEKAGADFIVIATNTMHKVAKEIQSGINIPILSLLDVVAEAILSLDIDCVGLLGTKYTMEDGFYSEALNKKGIRVLIPSQNDREEVHRVIFEELIAGEILKSSKEKYLAIIEELKSQGARGIILGCTEIPLLIQAEDTDVAVFDTTILHANASLYYALK